MIHLLVELTAKSDRITGLLTLLTYHARHSRLETGCFRFDVLHEKGNPCRVMLDEVWADPEALRAHHNTDHYARWRDESPALLESKGRREYLPWEPKDPPTATELLTTFARLARSAGKRIAFTNGCFDVIHAGHIATLREARAQADCLVVGLDDDAGVRELKGPGRPVNMLADRRAVLGSLGCVDLVVPYGGGYPLPLIQALRPDVLVKGGDYGPRYVVGADFVQSYGGRVHLVPIRPGLSTTGVIARMRAAV